MESGSSEMSQEFISSNSAVQVPTQNSATQIFLIKEELPNSEKKISQGVASNYHNHSDQHKFVRISSNASSTHLLPNRADETTMIISNDLSQNHVTPKKNIEIDIQSHSKKQRKYTKKKHSKSSEDGPYTCDKCKKSFIHEASLKAHVRRTYCQEAKSLKSRRIPIEWVRKSKVGDHYYCPTCGRAYDKLYSMRYHLASEACRRQTCNEKHEHNYINKQFENLNEALEYIKAQELDSQFHRRSCYSKNVYYACSRGQAKYVPKKKTKKTKTGCPAKFQLICKKLFQNEKGEEQDKRLDNVREVYTIKGCLAHSHETEDTDKMRLPQRTRKNIIQLLSLGVPLSLIKDKYLKPESFGGITGKIPRQGIFVALQRRNVPSKPDLTCSEKEIVNRYMAMTSVRAFNFLSKDDPTSTNPSYSISKASKEDSKFTPLARIVKAENTIIVFMDEEQRERFKMHPNTIIVNCTQNIYKLQNYYLLSLLVLDDFGEGAPILQTISACENLHSSANIIIESMRMLEPDACSKIRVVMSDELCYSPFIEAIANYLKPEILTTLPLHASFVDKYNKIVQSSLSSHTQRLDELIYALFKMNDLIQCKMDCIRLGLNGEIKSIPQLNFEQTHPNIEEWNAHQVIAQQKDAWNVLRTREEEGVGTVIDTFVVQSCNTGLICDPQTCAVRCKSCPPKSPCAHTLVCSCTTFNAKYVCEHLHFVLHHQCSHEHQNEISSQDHDYSTGKNNTQGPSYKDIRLQNQGIDIGMNLPPIGGQYKMDSSQGNNRLKQDELLDEKEFQDLKRDAINKLGSLIACLQHKPKSLSTQKMLNDLNSYLGNYSKMPNLTKYSTVVTKVNKRKRPIMRKLKEDGRFEGEVKQNTQLTSIEINKVSNFSTSLKHLPEDTKEGNDDTTNQHLEKPNATKHMKLIVVSSPSENNTVKSLTKIPSFATTVPIPPDLSYSLSDALNESKKFPLGPSKIVNADYFASDAGKRQSKQIIGLNAPRYNLLREALHVNVNEYCWCFLICSNVHITLEALAKEFNIKEREEILEKFILAKAVWSCQKCVHLQKPFDIELILTGYIECRVCSHWFHRSCCDNLDETIVDGNDENFIYVCENCVNMQNQATQEQSNDLQQTQHEVIMTTTEVRKDSSQQQQFVVLPSTVNVVDQVDFAMIYE